MTPLLPIKRGTGDPTPLESLSPANGGSGNVSGTGSGNISPGTYSTSPVSPVIHPTHIHPGEVSRSPLVPTYDSAPGSISFSHSTSPSQDLQDILEQFDPLTVIGSRRSAINASEDDNKGEEEEVPGKDNDLVPQNLNPSTGFESDTAVKDLIDETVSAPDVIAEDVKDDEPEAGQDPVLEGVTDGEPEVASVLLKPVADPVLNERSSQITEPFPKADNPPDHETTNLLPKNKQKAAPELSKSSSESLSQTSRLVSEKHPTTPQTINPIIKDEDVKPFDFQHFLDQLRHKSADPIARYVKSFLSEFNKRTWTTAEQVKIIGDFKAFIAVKMTLCPPFSTLSDSQMTNALEGMEKLIMNRLYTKTFSPEIPVNQRDDIHEEDVLRDRVLQEKMRIWHWIEGRHLDLADRFLRNGEAFVKLASDELIKINHYRAPRDKVICILNCCKVIFGLLRQTNSEQSADGFLPILIYVVIKAQPKDLISNLNYIQRFRNQDMLNGEAGYYLSSLSGAISFVESLDRSGLSISDEEFEINVEKSVRSIAEPSDSTTSPPRTPAREESPGPATGSTSIDEPTTSVPKQTSRPATPQGNLNASSVLYQSAGLLAAPFKSLSKVFEADPNSEDSAISQTDASASKPPKDAVSPSPSPEESAARQASAEEDEAQRIHQVEFQNVCKTLNQMFPTLDQEVVQDVLRETEGRVGAAVDVCLALLES